MNKRQYKKIKKKNDILWDKIPSYLFIQKDICNFIKDIYNNTNAMCVVLNNSVSKINPYKQF